MICVDLMDFSHLDIHFQNLEIFPESWTKRHHFAQYKNIPRPCSALFLVCTDIHVTFYPVNEKAVSANKGDLVWIPTGTCYYTVVDGGNENCIDTYTLNFRLINANGEDILLSDKITVIAKDQNRFFERHIKTLWQEQSNLLKIKSEFYALLDNIAISVQQGDAYYIIRSGIEALKNEWNINKKIDEYAAMCGVSCAYFYQCFREWSGKTPVEYRNMIRLSNAETMLRNTNMKISEISEMIGFEDSFYFCRVFKKHFGASPRNYRNKKD